jgi:NitT/TauT family transport system permease protein
MALNQGASDIQLIRTIVIPSSLPHMLTSLRLALGVAWIVLVPAEFLGVSSGLGYLINDARDTMEYDKLMAMIIAIGIIGFILDRFFQKLQHRLNWSWIE